MNGDPYLDSIASPEWYDSLMREGVPRLQRRGASKAEAEDCLHQSFLELTENGRAQQLSPDELSGHIIKRAAWRFSDMKRRNLEVPIDYDEDVDEEDMMDKIAWAGHEAERQVEGDPEYLFEVRYFTNEKLSHLDERSRFVVETIIFIGADRDEIAMYLGISRAYVDQVFHRAIKKLRSLSQDDEPPKRRFEK